MILSPERLTAYQPLHNQPRGTRYKTNRPLPNLEIDKQLSPWNSDYYFHSPFQRLSAETRNQHLSRLKANKNYDLLLLPEKSKLEKLKNRRLSLLRDDQEKEEAIKANVISMSLEEEDQQGQKIEYNFQRGAMPTFKQQPNRVKILKKKLQNKSKNLRMREEETKNNRMQMFSTCLTEHFTRTLVEDTLVIYPAMPKRDPPKLRQPRQKAYRSLDPNTRLFPNLYVSSDLARKAYDIKELKKGKTLICPSEYETLRI